MSTLRLTGMGWLLAAALAAGCGGKSAPAPADGGNGYGGSLSVRFTVSGHARLYPPGAAYLVSSGHPAPTLSGLTATLEEPLRAALADPNGNLGRQVLDLGGAFHFASVPNDLVDRLLALDVREDGDGGATHVDIAPAGSVLYDDELQGNPPLIDVDGGIAEVLPVRMVYALETSVGPANLQRATDGGTHQLLGAGYVLGAVLDGDGGAVPGVTLLTDDATLQGQLYYPNASFTGLSDAGTSSTGLFLFVHPGGEARAFRLNVSGRTEYLPRNAVSGPGVGLVMDLFPGKTHP